MRKSIIATEAGEAVAVAAKTANSLSVTELARVEVTSEDPEFPVENVFSDGTGGWRAGQPGDQVLRLIFDEPVEIAQIALLFEERAVTRTQEIVLRWKKTGSDWREIVRQQWNFNPDGSTSEAETWQVKLEQLGELELKIRPEIGGKPAFASLCRWAIS